LKYSVENQIDLATIAVASATRRRSISPAGGTGDYFLRIAGAFSIQQSLAFKRRRRSTCSALAFFSWSVLTSQVGRAFMYDSTLPPPPGRSTDVVNAATGNEPIALLAIRLIIGGLFLVTAALKTWSPAESAALAVAYDIPPQLTAVVVQFELLLAIVLLFGCWTRRALFASAILFAVFGAFSIFRGLAGFESCGCFGSFKVNPSITAVLDACMLVAAVWGAWKLASPRERIQPWRLYGAGGCYVLAAVAGFVGFMMQSPSTLTQGDEAIADDGGLIVLEPDEWIGKPFPLTRHLSPPISLDKGHWVLLLYHYDCPHCQEAVPKYELLANQFVNGRDQRIALIETPPYESAPPHVDGIVRARLAGAHEWFVQTPVEIQLENGVVVSASLELPAVSSASSVDLPSAAFTDSTYRRVSKNQRATAL
jgi:hypothetical protein